MGGNGSRSTSGRARLEKRSTRGYPKSMERLVDADGHISLSAVDYKGYKQEQIEAFLASRGYESMAVFDPDGGLILIDSQFDDGRVATDAYNYRTVLGLDQHRNPRLGYVDFHVHPITHDGDVEVLSDGDISHFARVAGYVDKSGNRVNDGFADTLRVRSSEGHWFQLAYRPTPEAGNARKFANTYESAIRVWCNTYWSMRRDGTISSRDSATMITNNADRWLRRNAPRYGFEYTSNWEWKDVKTK